MTERENLSLPGVHELRKEDERPSGYDSMLLMQQPWIWSPVRELRFHMSTKTLDRGSQHGPHGSIEQRCVTQSSKVRAIHTYMDPEMRGSQSGLVEAREKGRRESVFPAEGGTLTKVQRWEVTGCSQRIMNTLCWSMNTHQIFKWKMEKISINLKQIQKEWYFHGSVWNKKYWFIKFGPIRIHPSSTIFPFVLY